MESGLDLFVKGGDEGVQSFVQFQVLQTQAVNIESDMSVMLFLHGYQLAVELPQFCRGSRHLYGFLLAKETCYAVFPAGDRACTGTLVDDLGEMVVEQAV